MRVLFVNQYYAPDFAATAQLLQDTCEHLASEGCEVHMIASQAIYDGRDITPPEYEILNGVHVHRVPLACKGRERFRDRLWGYASFYLQAFTMAHRLPRPDVTVTLTTPPLISLLGVWMRFVLGVRHLYWVMDIYPDIAVRAGVLNQFGPAKTFWSALGWISYRTAHKVVALGRDMRSAILSKGIPDHKVEVVRTWADGDEIHPMEESSFRTEVAQPGETTIMYSGNLGVCHLFDEIVDVAKEMANHPIRFLFIGGGKQMTRVKEQLGDFSYVSFLPYQERSRLGESLSAGDIHLISLNPKYDGLLVPSKLYGILAAGRPVVFIGSHDNEIAYIIREADCGRVVAPGDRQSLLETLSDLAANGAERDRLGANGRRAFLAAYEKEKALSDFLRLVKALEKGVPKENLIHSDPIPPYHLVRDSATE